MKRNVIIFALIMYLFSNTELSQFFKVSTLISHYLEFKHNDDSFSNFLFCHYYGNDNDDSDNDIDDKLPFKSSCMLEDNETVSLITFIHLRNYAHKILFTNECQYKKNIFYFSFFSNIWQPPKV